MRITYEQSTGKVHAVFENEEESIAFLNCVQIGDEKAKQDIAMLIAQLELRSSKQRMN